MSTFEEVLERFPQRKFLLDQKDRAPRTTHALVELLRIKHPGAIPNLCLQATPERNAQCVDSLLKACAWPEPPEVGQCLFGYLRAPWRTKVPSVCAGRTLFVPDRYASRLLWGWPGTFVERMHAAGSRVMVMTEDPQRAEHLRQLGFDGVRTNPIEDFAAASVPGAPRGPITN